MSAIILIFRCRNDALLLRSFLLSNNVFAKVVDAPRQLSSSCGLAVEVQNFEANFLRELLQSCNKEKLVAGIFDVTWNNNIRSFVRV